MTEIERGAARLFGDARAVDVWLHGDDGALAPAADVVAAAGAEAGSRAAGPSPPPARLAARGARGAHAGPGGRGGRVRAGRARSRSAARPPASSSCTGRDAASFAKAEVEALQVLANQVAVAVENARLYRYVERQAIRDGLTGLFNHRYFQERLLQECALARRYDLPLSLLMIDVDDFKKFNDEFGHQLGDEVLREIGGILAGSVRHGIDLPARYGGEEFAIILPHTRADGEPPEGQAPKDGEEPLPPAGAGALVVAERLRRAIAERAFAGHGGRRYAHVTVTVGVAMSRPERRGRGGPRARRRRGPLCRQAWRPRPRGGPAVSSRDGPADVVALTSDVDLAIVASPGLDEMLAAVARRVVEALDVWECDIYEFRPESDELIAAAIWSRDLTQRDREWLGGSYPLAGRPSYRRLLEERTLRELQSDDPDLAPEDVAIMRSWGERSVISVPLVFQDQVMGALTLIEKRAPRHFGPEDLRLLGLMAAPAAVAVNTARMYRREAQQNRRLQALLSASRAMTTTMRLEDLLAAIAAAARTALESDECAIDIYDAAAGTIRIAAYDSVEPEDQREAYLGMTLALADYPADEAALLGGVIVEQRVSDPAVDERNRAVDDRP